MAINFPSPANTNDIYALGGKTWKFNGNAWELQPLTAGYTGSIGYTGSAGTNGYTGSAGTNGYTGSAGTNGYTGSAGTNGYTGSQGDIGYTGSAGTNGYTGSVGFTGSASTVIGFTGSQGNLGYTGSAGSGGGGETWEAKSANFNAAVSFGYFIDTTSGAITATLPASPTIGEKISFIDAAGTFDTNNLTVGRNGKNIQGIAEDMTVSLERAGFTLVFYDNTQGWLIKEK
jgi:hypothetical protein